MKQGQLSMPADILVDILIPTSITKNWEFSIKVGTVVH